MPKDNIMSILVVVNITLAYISYVPQIYKILKRKKAEDISMSSWVLWVSAALFDTAYVVLLGDTRLIVYSSTELVFTALVLILTIKYTGGRESYVNN